MSSIYGSMGVDALKRSIRVIENLTSKSFPYAFTNVLKLENGRCIALHVDGAGSKPIITYLAYKEFERTDLFERLSQDVLAMNLDDIVAAGVKPKLFVDYIALNPFKVDRQIVLKFIGSGFNNTLNSIANLNAYSKDYTPIFIGGETADMPDQLKTIDISGTVYGECDCNEVIDGLKVNVGDVILGLSSFGKAKYEQFENSGIMCNGLTLARHVLLNEYYALKYPETFDENNKLRYSGIYKLDSYVDDLGMTIMDALSSPTRIYTPIIAEVLSLYGYGVHGMAHITGGGFTKILKVGFSVDYVINFLPEPPPIFKLIQKHGKIGFEEMYSVFNMGIGFVIVTSPDLVDDIIQIIEKYGINVFVIGKVERNFDGVNRLLIRTENIRLNFIR